MDFLKIWCFERRRQRVNLYIIFPVLLAFAVLELSGIFQPVWKDKLTWLFLLAVSPSILFLSMDVFTRDFQQGTLPALLSLPVKTWKIYLVKYLFSLFLFLSFIFFIFAILHFSRNGNPLPYFSSWIAPYSDIVSMEVLGPFLSLAAILLYLHASIVMWCIAFRGVSGIAASFFLIPVVTFLLKPSFVWFTRDYAAGICEWLPQILFYVTVFAFIGGIFWCRGIGRGCPMWILTLKSLGILFASSVLSFIVFYGIQITEYMITLSEFEKTPGIEIPRGKVSVIRSIWEGKVPKSADDALNTDLKTMTGIPVKKYGKYYDRLMAFLGNSNLLINEEVKAKHFDKALRLLDTYESIPDCIIPKITWETLISHSHPGVTPFMTVKTIDVRSNLFTIRHFTERKYMLGTPLGEEIRSDFYLALPFEKATLPMINAMIARMEEKPLWKDIPIRILPLGDNAPGSIDGNRCRDDYALRDILPGLDKHGVERFCAAVNFVFNKNENFELARVLMRQETLAPAINSMKGWMWSAKLRNDIAKAVVRESFQMPPAPAIKRFVCYYDDKNTLHDFQMSYIRKYLWLPRFKLRKYALEHGTLPEKLSDALSESEIIHKTGDKIFELTYCVNPKQGKFHSLKIIKCHDYSGMRRLPHLHMTLKQYKDGKLVFCDPFFGKCDLDEPEPLLPRKGASK